MATTTVGGVNVEIGGTTTKLEGAMASSKAIVQRGMDSVQGAAQAVQGYLSMLGINAFAGYIKGAIDAAGQLADLAQKTGISAEVLSGFEYAAKMSGTTLEGVAGGLKKLATNMYEAGDGGKEQIKMFKDLGVEVIDANGKLKGTDVVLLELADKFAAMPDGADKSAQAVKVFGKAGADLIPLLNEGSEGIAKFRQRAQELGLVVSDDTASAMEALGDKFDTVEMASTGVARQFAASLTPTLTSVADAFLETTTQGGLMQGAIAVLAGTVKTLTTVGYGVASAFEQVGIMLGGVAAAVLNPTSAVDIFKDTLADASKAGDKWGAKMVSIWDEQVTATKKATDATDKNTRSHKSNTEERDKAVKKIADVIKALDDELKILGLSEKEKLVYKELVKAGVAADTEAGKAIRDKTLALAEGTENLKLYKDWQEANTKATKDHNAEIDKETQKLNDKLVTAQTELANYGLTRTQIESNTLSRMRETLAIRESEIATSNVCDQRWLDVEAMRAQVKAQEGIVEAITQTDVQIAQKKQAEDALKAWQDTSKDIEKALTDALLRGFESGKDMVTSLRDYVVNAFKTSVIKMLVQPIMGSLGALTGNSAIAGQGGVGSLSSLSSAASTLMTLGSTFGSSVMAGFSSTMASFGATTGLAIEGGMASIAAGTSTSIAAGLGQIAGTLGPYALAAVAVYGLLGGFKGEYVKSTGDAGISFDAQGNRTQKKAAGQYSYDANLTSEADKFVTDLNAIYLSTIKSLGGTAGYTDFYYGSNNSDGGKFTIGSGVGGKGGVYTSGEQKITDGAVQLAASQAVFAALQASEMPKILQGAFDGMIAGSMTRTQIEAAFAGARALNELQVGLLAMPFENLKNLSFEAAQGLIAASGGMDKLIGNLKSYYDTYYSEDEKASRSAANLVSSLSALGIDASQLKEKSDLRALIERIDPNQGQGAQQIAALLAIAPEFATLSEYLKANSISLLDAAAKADPQTEALTAMVTPTETTAAAVTNVAAGVEQTNVLLSGVTAAVTDGNAAIAAAVTAAVASASAASNAAISALTARLDALDSNNRLAAAG